MNDGADPHTVEPSWHQVFIHFHDYAAAEHVGTVHIGPEMTSAETAWEIVSWFFIRKNPCWRLRFRPMHDSTEQDAVTFIHQRLDRLQAAGHIANWVKTIYEPETYAFGGAAGMDLAHRLFHLDSRHLLAYLDGTKHQPANRHRRELSILLCSNLLHAAGLDWYEEGDVWARVADHRQRPEQILEDSLRALRGDLRRLMSVGISSRARENLPLAFSGEWVSAFTAAGTELAAMAADGRLRRGLRAVLAHHIIFSWNRHGLPHATQAVLAHTAKSVVFGRDPTAAHQTEKREER